MDITLNQTPIRTSRNYQINDITLKNVKIPTDFSLKKSKISYNTVSAKDYILDIEEIEESEDEFEAEEINDEIANFMTKPLTYGNGEFADKQINEKCNFEKFVQINSIMSNEISFDFEIAKDEALVESIFINSEENTNASVYVIYKGNGYHNGEIRINIKRGAQMKFFLINLMADLREVQNYIAIESRLEPDSKLDFTIIDIGAQNSISNYYTNLVGERAESNLNTIYLGRDDQIIDMNYIAEVRGKASKVNFEVQGALTDEAKKHFKGTIDFKSGCTKSIGSENEFCTLLSDKAKAISLPNLLCSEEDVEGAHSTAAGKPSNKELFYILSRGFDEKAAEKLLVKARFNFILNKIKNENLRDLITTRIDHLIDCSSKKECPHRRKDGKCSK